MTVFARGWAIAAVTASMIQLLGRVIEDEDLGGAKVEYKRPSELPASGRILNLYLFGVAPNPAYRNADLPFRDSNGARVGQPVLALNLSYLLTAMGDRNDELDAHHLLGHAMSIVHDNAVMTRDHVRRALAGFTFPALAKSDLADQVEPVKLTPLALGNEEISKLWPAFNTSYRLSVAYEASLVLIQRQRPVRAAPRVRRAGVHAVPMRRPVIDSLDPQIARVGQTLTIRGHALGALEGTRVRFPSGPADPNSVRDNRLEVLLPGGLRAGPNTVQVLHQVRMGDPPAPGQPPPLHRGFESNTGVFVLVPEITTPLPDPPNLRTVARGTDLSLTVRPPVARDQPVALILGEHVIEDVVRPRPPAVPPETTTTLTFRIPPAASGFPAGAFLVQVRVEGAESPLQLQADPTLPSYNQYVGPKVQVT
ncbi:MAG: Pvc16 family protein [Actinomycetota bacterium]|nr:Pvc16 family protein [Actinomycetota bacterium]